MAEKRSFRSLLFTPIRKLVTAIGRRVFWREFETLGQVAELQSQVHALRQELSSVAGQMPPESRFEPIAYLACEHEAITRRLARIEDRLDQILSQTESRSRVA